MSSQSRRRSLSEGSSLSSSTLEAQEEPPLVLPSNGLVDDQHPVSPEEESLAVLEQRSKSESFICTAQGIVFQDTKCQKYWSKLNNLVALATGSSSSHCNVVLAKKALRYRKVLERHRSMA